MPLDRLPPRLDLRRPSRQVNDDGRLRPFGWFHHHCASTTAPDRFGHGLEKTAREKCNPGRSTNFVGRCELVAERQEAGSLGGPKKGGLRRRQGRVAL